MSLVVAMQHEADGSLGVSDALLNGLPQFGKGTNEEVGSDYVTIAMKANGKSWLSAEAALPDGTISIAGEIVPPPDGQSMRFPVTGGTGRYENATGELVVGPGGDYVTNTYFLNLGE